MLNWLESLYADWKRTRQPGTEPTAAWSGNGVTEGDEREETGRTAAGESVAREDRALPEQDLLEGEQVSKRDVRVELGLQPHEFIAWLVRSSGGRMWQAEVVDVTGWSKSSVSRYLGTLESDDVVERVRIGRRKLVAVPREMPDAVPATDDPSVDLPAGSWTPEVDEPA